MLKVVDVSVNIQAVQILRGFNMQVKAGEMVGLVGRNGAGKTSLLRTIMGHLKASSGQLSWCDEDLIASPRHARAGMGIGYMPEDRGLVPELTVEENICVPLWVNKKLVLEERLARVYTILPELKEMKDRRALLLSGGQQKLVALARAVAIGTNVLLLDEPFEGVAPALSQRLSEVIFGLRDSNLTVLIAQSELNHAASMLDQEVMIERGANG
jgi:branched-chain amino acid transport system ATP-binding protein